MLLVICGDAKKGRLGIGDPGPIREEIRKERVKMFALSRHLDELTIERKKW